MYLNLSDFREVVSLENCGAKAHRLSHQRKANRKLWHNRPTGYQRVVGVGAMGTWDFVVPDKNKQEWHQEILNNPMQSAHAQIRETANSVCASRVLFI